MLLACRLSSISWYCSMYCMFVDSNTSGHGTRATLLYCVSHLYPRNENCTESSSVTHSWYFSKCYWGGKILKPVPEALFLGGLKTLSLRGGIFREIPYSPSLSVKKNIGTSKQHLCNLHEHQIQFWYKPARLCAAFSATQCFFTSNSTSDLPVDARERLVSSGPSQPPLFSHAKEDDVAQEGKQ